MIFLNYGIPTTSERSFLPISLRRDPFLLTEADACLRLQLDNFSDDNTILQAGGDTNPLDFASATLVLTFSSWESIVVLI